MTVRRNSSRTAAAWRAHNLSQLEYFASLSLAAKMRAVEGMADVVRRLTEMRERGELKPVSRRIACHGGRADGEVLD
ncbi:MAG: hypothetical protein HYY18_10090 [Planctomycetes bacterium]|nr:hypothetical protein [Planctomycetota bacterium]